MKYPKLLAISDDGAGREAWMRVIDGLAGVEGAWFLHRRPGLSVARYAAECADLAQRCRDRGIPFVVHRRLDIARALGAHLHLPASALPPARVRPHLRPTQALSVSWHSGEPCSRVAGADFALAAPVFAPTSKPKDTRRPLGAAGVEEAGRALGLPVLALGGVGVDQAKQLVGRVQGLACIGSLSRAVDVGVAARALLLALEARTSA